jgi:hypothetical protein
MQGTSWASASFGEAAFQDQHHQRVQSYLFSWAKGQLGHN